MDRSRRNPTAAAGAPGGNKAVSIRKPPLKPAIPAKQLRGAATAVKLPIISKPQINNYINRNLLVAGPNKPAVTGAAAASKPNLPLKFGSRPYAATTASNRAKSGAAAQNRSAQAVVTVRGGSAAAQAKKSKPLKTHVMPAMPIKPAAPEKKVYAAPMEEVLSETTRLQRIKDWRERFLHMKFYFDGLDSTKAYRLKTMITNLGGEVLRFLSFDVTHFVTANPDAFDVSRNVNITGVEGPDVMHIAKDLEVSLWTVERLEHVLYCVSDTNDLEKALRNEKIFGVNGQTKSSNLKPLNQLYLLIEEPSGQYKPVAAKEYPINHDFQNPPYPIIRFGAHSRQTVFAPKSTLSPDQELATSSEAEAENEENTAPEQAIIEQATKPERNASGFLSGSIAQTTLRKLQDNPAITKLAARHAVTSRATNINAYNKRVREEEEQAVEEQARAKRAKNYHVYPMIFQKGGFCENCNSKYDEYSRHIKSVKHRKYATNPSNFHQLDYLFKKSRRVRTDDETSDSDDNDEEDEEEEEEEDEDSVDEHENDEDDDVSDKESEAGGVADHLKTDLVVAAAETVENAEDVEMENVQDEESEPNVSMLATENLPSENAVKGKVFDANGNELYHIEYIRGKRYDKLSKGSIEYLCKWVGYPIKESTWEIYEENDKEWKGELEHIERFEENLRLVKAKAIMLGGDDLDDSKLTSIADIGARDEEEREKLPSEHQFTVPCPDQPITKKTISSLLLNQDTQSIVQDSCADQSNIVETSRITPNVRGIKHRKSLVTPAAAKSNPSSRRTSSRISVRRENKKAEVGTSASA